MSALSSILMAAASGWALITTILAIVWSRSLRRERQGHEDTQELIARYRSALAKLDEKAAGLTEQLNALQREHSELRHSLDAQSQEPVEQPVPTIVIDGLDISGEIGLLFEHVARVAATIRNYSAYTRGHSAPEQNKARYDLLWLSDSLHSLDKIGKALASGSLKALSAACSELLSMYDAYLKDTSGYNSRDTFQRLSDSVPLAEVKDAIRSITIKAAPATTPAHGAAPATFELDRSLLSAAAPELSRARQARS